MNRRSALLVFALVGAAMLAAGGAPALTPPPPGHPVPVSNASAKRIVFHSYAGYSAIEQIDPDGSNRKVLIEGTSASQPDQTADATRLVYVQDGTLRVANGDGTGRAKLGGRDVYGTRPRWSPDGRRVAFNRTSADGRGNPPTFAVIDADGANEMVVGTGANPDWSPDGHRLAFDANGRVWVTEPRAGATAVAITPPPPGDGTGVAVTPAWSPDGTLIGFATSSPCTYVVHPDGSGLRIFACEGRYPTSVHGWSPASRHLLATESGIHQDANLVWRTDDGVLHQVNRAVSGSWTKPSGPSACPRPYWMLGRDGGVFTFGGARFFGSTGGMRLVQPVLGMAATPTASGYWLVAGDGGVFTFGDAGFYGSTGGMRLRRPVVGMAATPSGKGYWLVASDGGVFTFGDATFHGSTGAIALKQPIVGMAATPSGKGYWLVASDGGVFTFGDAAFHGSTGAIALREPIVGMAPLPDGDGYWLVARDGGVFTFGKARFEGSAAQPGLGSPVVATASGLTTDGLFLASADGQMVALGAARFCGSAKPLALAAPIVGIAAARP